MEPWSVENDVCPRQLPKSWTNNRANIPSLMLLNLGCLISKSKSMDTDVILFCIYRALLELDYGYQCWLCEMCLGLREPPLFSLNPTLPLSLICHKNQILPGHFWNIKFHYIEAAGFTTGIYLWQTAYLAIEIVRCYCGNGRRAVKVTQMALSSGLAEGKRHQVSWQTNSEPLKCSPSDYWSADQCRQITSRDCSSLQELMSAVCSGSVQQTKMSIWRWVDCEQTQCKIWFL